MLKALRNRELTGNNKTFGGKHVTHECHSSCDGPWRSYKIVGCFYAIVPKLSTFDTEYENKRYTYMGWRYPLDQHGKLCGNECFPPSISKHTGKENEAEESECGIQ